MSKSEKYKGFLNAFPDPVWLADYNTGTLLGVNSAYTVLFNSDVERITLGELLVGLIEHAHIGDRGLLKIMFSRFIENAQEFQLQWRHIINGEEYKLTAKGRCIDFNRGLEGVAGQEPLLLCVLEDITEITETGALNFEQRRHLDDISRLKSMIIENIGHEFRTPVTAIMGFSDLLESRMSDETSTQYLSHIRNSSQRLLHTLESILEYAVIYSDSNSLFLSEFQLEDLLENELLLLQQKATEKELYLQVDIQQHQRIRSDRKKLVSIIYRYVDNAIKFTETGGVRINVAVTNDNFLKIEVADTGIGVARDLKHVLFEPFRVGKANQLVTRVGIGMGLSIVKSYSQTLGGNVWLESNEYGGVTAKAMIPLAKVEVLQETVANGNRKRILYVEDNNILQLMMSNAFPKVIVDKAMNAEQALELVNHYVYPLVFIDINLGSGMDGAQLCKYLRNMPQYHQSKIIAATANYNFANREMLNRYGFDDFLLKPLNIAAMRKIVAAIK